MKLFGLSFTEARPTELDDPVYTRFSANKIERTTRQSKRHERLIVPAPAPSVPRPAARTQDPLYCEDGLDTSVLRAALPQRFADLQADVIAQARHAARELAAPAH